MLRILCVLSLILGLQAVAVPCVFAQSFDPSGVNGGPSGGTGGAGTR